MSFHKIILPVWFIDNLVLIIPSKRFATPFIDATFKDEERCFRLRFEFAKRKLVLVLYCYNQ